MIKSAQIANPNRYGDRMVFMFERFEVRRKENKIIPINLSIVFVYILTLVSSVSGRLWMVDTFTFGCKFGFYMPSFSSRYIYFVYSAATAKYCRRRFILNVFKRMKGILRIYYKILNISFIWESCCW